MGASVGAYDRQMRRFLLALAGFVALVGLASLSTSSANAATLQWKPCADNSSDRCAKLKVPRDWARPSGKTFAVAMRMLPATGPRSKRIGALFTNPGGPGTPGTETLHLYFDNNTAIRSRFDVISWDPRGTGSTTPLPKPCRAVEFGAWSPGSGPYAMVDIAQQAIDARAAFMNECWDKNSRLAKYMGTNNVVRDLEAMRSALGVRKISYIGYSYGTTIGREYAMRYPTRVRAMLLDGATTPAPTMTAMIKSHVLDVPTASDDAFARMPADFAAAYLDVERALQVAPSANFTRWTFWQRAAKSLASVMEMDLLKGLICSAGQDIGIEVPAGCGQAMRPSMLVSPAMNLTYCADRKGRPTATDLVRLLGTVRPMPAMNVLDYGTLCAGTPAAWDPLRAPTRVRLSTPPLIVNGEFDPATPISGASANLKYFRGSRLVTVNTGRHGIYGLIGESSWCANRIGSDYLINKSLPSQNVRCQMLTNG